MTLGFSEISFSSDLAVSWLIKKERRRWIGFLRFKNVGAIMIGFSLLRPFALSGVRCLGVSDGIMRRPLRRRVLRFRGGNTIGLTHIEFQEGERQWKRRNHDGQRLERESSHVHRSLFSGE
jgi:hypothetical protein